MAAKGDAEPKRPKSARPKQSGGPEGRGNFACARNWRFSAKGKIVAAAGFWAATAAIGRNAMQPESGALDRERWEYAANADRQEQKTLKKKRGGWRFYLSQLLSRERSAKTVTMHPGSKFI